MKKILKAIKLFGIAATASAALLAGLYFYDTKAIANDDVDMWFSTNTVEKETVVVDTALKASSEVKSNAAVLENETAAEEILTIQTEEVITVAETEETEKATEKATADSTVASHTEAATEAPATEAATEKNTEAVTETPVTETAAPVTETAAPVAETSAPAPALTNIVYKDINGNSVNFSSIEEAKASLNVAVLPNPAGTAAANKVTYASEAAQVLELINQYRTANGLAALTYNDALSTAAMERAAENAYADWNMTAMENGSKRHIRPNFQKASSIKDEYGFTGNWGENFGRYQENAEGIVAGWKASASHNALLLSADYSRIGIGVAQDSEGYFYWIALFN